MSIPLRVLLVEKEEKDRELITQQLERGGFEVEIQTVGTEREYFTQLDADHDVIISQYALMQFDALRALEILKEKELDIPFIVIGGKVGEELAVESIKQGAADFLLKARLNRLGQVVKRVVQESKVQREKKQTEASLEEGVTRYRNLLETCPVGIALVRQGELTFVNRAGAHLLGAASPKQLLDRPLADFTQPDSQESLEERLHQTETEGTDTILLQEKFVRLDGQEIDVEVEAVSATDNGNQATLLVLRDITGQERQERLLPFHTNLLAQLPDAVVAVDNDRSITYWNRSAEKMYDIASEEVLGRKLDEVYQQRWFNAEDEKASEEALATTGFWRGNKIHDVKTGKEIHVSSSVSRLHDETGEISGLVSVTRDITRQRQTEDTFKKERNFYSSVLGAAASLVLVLDKEGRILLFNRACEELSGYSVNEVRKKHLWDFLMSPEEAQSAQAFFKDLKSDQFPHSHEDYWITKDATRRLVAWSERALTDEKGSVACVVATGAEISEHREAKEAKHESAEYFRSLVENAADTLIILDKDGIIRFESPSLEKMLGYKPGEFEEKSFRELVHPDNVPIFSNTMEEVKKKPGATALMQFQLQNKEGTWISVEGLSKNLLSDPAISGIVLTTRDITKRKKAEKGIQRQLQTLDAIHAIDVATSSGLDLQVTTKVILEQLTAQLGVDAASVLLFNPDTHVLKHFSGLGFRSIAVTRSHVSLGEGIAGKAALERELIHILDLRDSEEGSKRAELLAEEEFVTYYALPLVARGELKGVLEIFHRSPLSPNADWLEFLSTVGSQAALSIDNADLIDKLQRHNTGLGFAYDTTLEKISHALDLREQLSGGHSQRLAEWTLQLGEVVGMEGRDLVHERRGALLHDIGKIRIPESILLKPGPLTDEEWEIMRKHPGYSFQLLSDIPYLRSAVSIPYCHHEKWDGSGYPRGLKGKEIPLSARVFAIVEAWDVLCCDRPYRKAWPAEKAREHLRSHSGIDFDPEIVEKFLELEKEGEFAPATPSESIPVEETEKPSIEPAVEETIDEVGIVTEEPALEETTEEMETVTEEPALEETTEEMETVTKEPALEETTEEMETVTKEPALEETTEEMETVTEEPKGTEEPPEEETIELKGTVTEELQGEEQEATLEATAPASPLEDITEEEVEEKGREEKGTDT